jgi:hypothetical protein
MVNHPHRKRRATVTAAIASVAEHTHEAEYANLRNSVREAFAAALAAGRLFTTDASDLFDLYLDKLPGERQVHNCTACRRFVKDYGGLVAISADGHAIPAMWDADLAPDYYGVTVRALYAASKKARVTGPFMSREGVWGIPRTGEWSHFSVEPPASIKFRHGILTPNQAMAVKREDFRTVATALADFTPAMLAEALRLLEAETLARSERFIGPVKWLADLHAARAAAKDSRIRDNLLWRAVAAAPDGFCHPRASVVGSLLEDIAAGLAFADIKARFNAKLHPLQYQRPQAAPSAGNIAAAEKIVERMGIAPSLERRFARLDELEAIWKPKAPHAAPKGATVFGHLQSKDAAESVAVNMPTLTMTWVKFAAKILPGAEAVQFAVPSHGNFIAFTSATNMDAPPILKWDREDKRNPVAWYVYHGGSTASQWGLRVGWCKMNAACLPPPQWGDKPMPELGTGVVLVLDGAADTRSGQGNALFPESLHGELHAVRATIEAYSRRAEIGGREEASACGYHLGKGRINVTLRVTSAGQLTDYRIDRWD